MICLVVVQCMHDIVCIGFRRVVQFGCVLMYAQLQSDLCDICVLLARMRVCPRMRAARHIERVHLSSTVFIGFRLHSARSDLFGRVVLHARHGLIRFSFAELCSDSFGCVLMHAQLQSNLCDIILE